MHSYGHNGLDLKIFNIVKGIKNGFFVEAGANDGVRQNNTAVLEQYLNWTGILVEPNKKLSDICKTVRTKSIVENYCLVSDRFEDSHIEGFFRSTDYGESLMAQVSHLDEIKDIHKGRPTIKVPCCTLNHLLEKNNVKNIDLFVLDVEGYEKEVLNGFNIKKYKPSFVVIEIFRSSKYRKDLFEYFESAGYKHDGLLSHHDHLFSIQ